MINITTIVGARPQFVKAAAFSRAVRTAREKDETSVRERIVHTGQHYDHGMSQVFFDDLDIPHPDRNLGMGGGGHGKQTGRMLEAIEEDLMEHQPDVLLLFGDTNSTLAGAIAACKLHIPVAHVEAGLRSFNRRMPEEINRVLTDEVSRWLFCPTPVAVENLHKESITQGVSQPGDVMYDCALYYREKAQGLVENMLAEEGLEPGKYYLATVHRAENTDDVERLISIVESLNAVANKVGPVVLPLHPRTKAALANCPGCPAIGKNVKIVPPTPYLKMVGLEENAAGILTDSGGVQKEAHFFETPCYTLRDETEWVETLENNCNQILKPGEGLVERVLQAIDAEKGPWNKPYGDGNAAGQILATLQQDLS